MPRTGSRSISQALACLDPRSPTAVIRAVKRNLHHYHVFESGLLDQHPDYLLVAVHRNPYERIRSHFKYRKKYGNPQILKSFSFAEYIEWVCSDAPRDDIGPVLKDQPITEMLPIEKVTHWLRFAQLSEDWAKLKESVLPSLPELPSINQSGSMFDSDSVYNEALANQIAVRFEQDFQQFNYAVDSWRDDA